LHNLTIPENPVAIESYTTPRDVTNLTSTPNDLRNNFVAHIMRPTPHHEVRLTSQPNPSPATSGANSVR